MNDRAFWISLFVVAVLVTVSGVFSEASKRPTPKPEIETLITHTNVNATVVTWTKTDNGRQIVWGFVELNGRMIPLIPYTTNP